MWATAVSKRCGITMATRSPRCTPRRVQRVAQAVGLALQLGVAAACAARPSSCSQRIATAAAACARAQRAQQTSAMLKCSRHLPAEAGMQGGVVIRIHAGELRRAAARAASGQAPKRFSASPVMRQMRQSGITVAPIFS